MIKENLSKEEKINNAISEAHITSYLNRIGSLLFWSLLFIFIIELFVIIFTKLGYFPKHLSITKDKNTSYEFFVGNIIFHNILSWLVFIIYLILYKKANYTLKKILVCSVYLIITTIYCFGLYRFSYLSFLYVLPVIVTCPLGKKYRVGVFSISLIMTELYSLYQQILLKSDFNFLINTVSLIALVSSYLICRNVYHSFTRAILDIEAYSYEAAKLHDDIAHDFVTGAMSKYTLYQDLAHNSEYISIAFIDVDNFKDVNDKKGHSVGDDIIKNLVMCFKIRKEKIYRYGGDEFIILSPLDTEKLAEKIEIIKTHFIKSSKELYNCDTSFSAGITNINIDDNITEVIKKCDNLMYTSKKSGKNKITISK